MFQYYMQNCTLTYRNRQLFATFCYKCAVKCGLCVFLESLYLLQVHEKNIIKSVSHMFFTLFREEKRCFLCLFIGFELWLLWRRIMYTSDNQSFRRTPNSTGVQRSAFSNHMRGCNFSFITYIIYITY